MFAGGVLLRALEVVCGLLCSSCSFASRVELSTSS